MKPETWQCIHIPDGSVVVSGELFDMACAAIGERDELRAQIERLSEGVQLLERARERLASNEPSEQYFLTCIGNWLSQHRPQSQSSCTHAAGGGWAKFCPDCGRFIVRTGNQP